MKKLSQSDVLKMLKDDQGERSAAEYARQIGISPQYLSDIYCGRRDPGPAVLEYLGLQKTEFYIPQKEQASL